MDALGRTVSFKVYTQIDPLKLLAMHANPQPDLFPDGITAGGDAAISLHGMAGSRRFESIHLFHEPSGGGNGSGSGASWTMTAAPPLPTTEVAMLPWGG